MINLTKLKSILNIRTRKRLACFFLYFFFFLSVSPLFAGEDADSLKRMLASCKQQDRAKILNDLANATFGEMPEQAILYAAEALNNSREYDNAQEEARALFMLAESYVTQGNQAKAIVYYEQSAAIEKRVGGNGSENYINRLGDIGYSYYIMGQPLKALVYLQESLHLSLKNGFDTQAASMYSNIGGIYTEWGDYSKGLINNQMALVIDQRAGDLRQVSTDMNNIGKIYEQWGKYDLAVKYYQEAMEIAKKTGNQNMIAVRLNNLGIVYKAWKKYPEALSYFQEALAIDRSVGNQDKVGKRLAYIGSTYLAMGNYDQSFSYLNQAFPLIKNSELPEELARLYHIYGRYYLAIQNYPDAVDYFRKSQELAMQKNLKPLQLDNLQGLSEALEKTGKAQQSLDALKRFLAIKDSVFTAESDERMAEFQARFDNEKMKLENELLRKDVQTKQNYYLFTGILGFSLILILLAFIFILRLKSRNTFQAKEIAEQNAIRYQSDLETKNRELAFQAISIIKSNETITSIVEGLDKNLKDGQQAENLNAALNQIRHLEKDKSWKEFETHFTQVHSDFYQKLNEAFPDLTPNERKLCAFLRLNMTTKDIASITHQSVHSINVARTRLRKKMNLANSDENLVNYLMQV